MPRAAALFRQADLARALRAANDAGVLVRVEVQKDKLTVETIGPAPVNSGENAPPLNGPAREIRL